MPGQGLFMKILLFGSNGMLGKALHKCLQEDYELILGTRHNCDLNNTHNIEDFIVKHKPDIVINSSAIIDVNLCEEDRDLAFMVNAYSVAKMAAACNKISAKLIQISTDHYYHSDGKKRHTENDPIVLLNYYAHTKFMGETYARLADDNLIIRTSIIGFGSSPVRKGFLEWVIENIENNKQLTLFNDYFTSSIDIYSFAQILKRMIHKDIRGLYNVASCDINSKAEFVELLSHKLGAQLNNPIYTSVYNPEILLVKRANSLGLCVNKIQDNLGFEMPNTTQVIDQLIRVYNEQKNNC